jgi:hypothetical protein
VEDCQAAALAEFDRLAALSTDPNRTRERDAISGIVAAAFAELRQYGPAPVPLRPRLRLVPAAPRRERDQPHRRPAQTGRTLLFAVGSAEVGTANREGREAWARDMLRKGMASMFLLLPQVELAKGLDVAGAAARAGARVPRRFVALWEAEAGRPG